jgi:hypothetical protein
MPKRKPQPDDFDVAEFLRESDDDLKSALHSLLRTPEAEIPRNLGLEPDSGPPLKLDNLDAGPELAPDSQIPLTQDPVRSSKLDAHLNLTSPPHLNSQSDLVSLPILEAPLNLVSAKRRFAIREMTRATDAHTRAEQHVYERLWEIAQPYDEISRAVTIGFGAMANLVGLSESNARINLRSLLAKLAIEEIAEYNCERSQGRTYRIFNEAEILRRRREAGLRWYMRRTLAVVFVDPATGQPLLKSKPLRRQGRS